MKGTINSHSGVLPNPSESHTRSDLVFSPWQLSKIGQTFFCFSTFFQMISIDLPWMAWVKKTC